MIHLTPATLRAATGCTADAADIYAQPLAEACAYYGINTAARLAAFLAQLGHESGSLRHVRELWGPTPAQVRYEGRRDLGNIYPGDGERYKGHGLIQITGRANHAAARDRLQAEFGVDEVPDFERNPEALELPRWACLSAAEFWSRHGCNELADAGQFEAITRRINGGLNGQDDRLARWERAARVLGTDPAPIATPPAAAPERPAAADLAQSAPTPPTTMKGGHMPSFSEIIRRPETAGLLSLVNPLLGLVPSIAKLFLDGEKTVPERNVAVAVAVADAAQKALADAGRPADNMQQVVEAIATDPAAKDIVRAGILADCGHLVEAGGGGIEGAREADAAATARGDMLHSPSFWIAAALLLLVFWMMGNVMGLYGAEMDEKVRSAIINGAQGMILGGIVGYFFGQTTSRNRTPAP